MSLSAEKILIVIAGPTGIGKTKTAIKLANLFNAEIFSADSRQLYKEMSIGTAKPSKAEMAGIKHHFIDHISIHDHYNAGMYEREINDKLIEYFKSHNIAILTGGTGLYIKAAIEGLDNFPDIPPTITLKWEELYNSKGLEHLQSLLLIEDPSYYNKVDLHNPMRLIRALSVIDSSGHPFSYYLNKAKAKREYRTVQIHLTMDRTMLYQKINSRVIEMVKNGLVNEVEALLKHKELKSLKSVGYSEIISFLEGTFNLERAIELIQRNSRRYAKRQITWFNNQGKWAKLEVSDFDKILDFVQKQI